MKSLNGKTAIVTGGASGIGCATARRLVQEWCSVTIWDVHPAALEDSVHAGYCPTAGSNSFLCSRGSPGV